MSGERSAKRSISKRLPGNITNLFTLKRVRSLEVQAQRLDTFSSTLAPGRIDTHISLRAKPNFTSLPHLSTLSFLSVSPQL